MIQIEDKDLPIDAAKKIITGKKELQLSPLGEAVYGAYNDNSSAIYVDMYKINQIKEIAEHLLAYCANQPED